MLFGLGRALARSAVEHLASQVDQRQGGPASPRLGRVVAARHRHREHRLSVAPRGRAPRRDVGERNRLALPETLDQLFAIPHLFTAARCASETHGGVGPPKVIEPGRFHAVAFKTKPNGYVRGEEESQGER